MNKADLPLPPRDSSMAMAVYRLEQISNAIQQTVRRKKARVGGYGLRVPQGAYQHFRRQAYELLSHYVGHDFEAAFGWLLAMRNAAPKRSRGSVAGNPFHLGLLAMTAAAGEFISRNKLRDLGSLMQAAYAEGVQATKFENFVSTDRRRKAKDVANFIEWSLQKPRAKLLERRIAQSSSGPSSEGGRPNKYYDNSQSSLEDD